MSSPFNILDNMFKNAMSLNDNREIFVFIFAMALESPPNSRGQPLGWTPCSSGACSPSGGPRICPRTGHFLVFNKEDLSFYYEIWEPFGPTVIFSPLYLITFSNLILNLLGKNESFLKPHGVKQAWTKVQAMTTSFGNHTFNLNLKSANLATKHDAIMHLKMA